MLIHKQVIYIRSGIQLLTNTGCKLVTSLWSFNCRVHRPGWYTRKPHCTHSPLSAPLKMHLLWVTWSQQLRATSQSQGRVTMSVAASPLCSAAASLDGPNLVWLCPALSGVRNHGKHWVKPWLCLRKIWEHYFYHTQQNFNNIINLTKLVLITQRCLYR